MTQFARDLDAWYRAVARELPWRRTRDPYALLVSEVMLQQTQVARVIPRYVAWLERWPTVVALAAATRAEVLAEWVGLGYNRRALRLHEAATLLAREGWPPDAAGLRALPGIGAYTAAAVASFAWDEAVVAEDVNAKRVLGRVGASGRELLGTAPAAAFNQAMMELGATVCRARTADCGACPVASHCASAGAVSFPSPSRGPRQAFEETNRYVRGRVVAALAAGELLPTDITEERLARAVDGLVADGILSRGPLGLSLG